MALKGGDGVFGYYENEALDIYRVKRLEEHSFEAHIHDRVEIVYCFSGSQCVVIGDKEYTVSEGEAVVIFPNVMHEYKIGRPESIKETRAVVIVCKASMLSYVFPDITEMLPYDPVISSESVSEEMARAFLKVWDTDESAELLGWTYIILSDLMKRIPLYPKSRLERSELAPRIISYISENYNKPLGIRYLSEKLGYSQSYITHLFCDRLKIPFNVYLSSIRCDRAAHLMKTTDMSLSEIAREVGYEYLNTFGRCFKRRFGTTPSKSKQGLSQK